MYHTNEFICSMCTVELGGKEVFEDEEKGLLYCSECHSTHIKKKCDTCKGQVIGTSIEAFDKIYHPHHFVCNKCKKLLSGDYFKNEGHPVCEECFEVRKKEVCEACGLVIDGKRSDMDDKFFHTECLKCDYCSELVGNSKVVKFKGNIYHETCFVDKKIFKCSFCKSVILGNYIRHKNKEYFLHVDCYPYVKNIDNIL